MQLPGASTCHRFVAGYSSSSLQSLKANGARKPGMVCLRAKHIYAAVATANDSAVLAWDPPMPNNERPMTCLALVTFPGMRLRLISGTDLVSALLFDRLTSSLLVVSYTDAMVLQVDELDAASLQPRRRFRLPLHIAWVLQAPRLSSGWLLFIGSELPYLGSLLAIDLQTSNIYQQDPVKGSSGTTRRQQLPQQVFVQQLSDLPVYPVDGSVGHLGVSGDGPCVAATVEAPDSWAAP